MMKNTHIYRLPYALCYSILSKNTAKFMAEIFSCFDYARNQSWWCSLYSTQQKQTNRICDRFSQAPEHAHPRSHNRFRMKLLSDDTHEYHLSHLRMMTLYQATCRWCTSKTLTLSICSSIRWTKTSIHQTDFVNIIRICTQFMFFTLSESLFLNVTMRPSNYARVRISFISLPKNGRVLLISQQCHRRKFLSIYEIWKEKPW